MVDKMIINKLTYQLLSMFELWFFNHFKDQANLQLFV